MHSILTSSSPLTSMRATRTFPSALPYGLLAKAPSPHILSLSNIYDISSIQTPQVNPSEPVALPHLLKMVSPPQSSKPSADGLLMLSRFTFAKTLSSSRHSCLDRRHDHNLPLSMLWNLNYFLQTFFSIHKLFSRYLQTLLNYECFPDLHPSERTCMYLPLAFPLTPHIPHYMTSSHPKSLLLTYFLYSLYRTIAIP